MSPLPPTDFSIRIQSAKVVLAYPPNILKDVDRGRDVSSAPWHDKFNGERRNDHHTTLAEKRAARGGAA